jgi:hypothetical protein
MGAMQVSAQQRASEKPLSAFYSAEMKKKMDAAPVQQHSVNEKRASEKPLSAFLSTEMQQRLNARTPHPAVPANVRRASQKPLSAFYSTAMKERISTKPNAFSPAASKPSSN